MYWIDKMVKIIIDLPDELKNDLQKRADERFNGDIHQVILDAINWWIGNK